MFQGHYYIKNFIPNGNKYPAAIPWSKILIEIQLANGKSKLFIDLKFYATIDHDAKYRKIG